MCGIDFSYSMSKKKERKRRHSGDKGGKDDAIVKKEPKEEEGSKEAGNEEVSDSYILPLAKINEHITCPLCKGYLVDATTVTECLHTFCKSCILTYFEDEDNNCPHPACGQLIHQSHPSHYVAFDRTMQDIVYKLVPGMFEEEKARRLEFMKEQKKEQGVEEDEDEPEQKEEEEKDAAPLGANKCYEGNPRISHHRSDEQVTVCLEPDGEGLRVLARPIVRLSHMATVNTLKRYIAMELWSAASVSRYSELDVFCNGELMGRDFSMRFIQLTRWRKHKDTPVRLVYRTHVDY